MRKPLNSGERRQRFSIRKFSIGVASATIGFALLGGAFLGQPDLVQGQQQVKIDYHYINYEDLTAQ